MATRTASGHFIGDLGQRKMRKGNLTEASGHSLSLFRTEGWDGP